MSDAEEFGDDHIGDRFDAIDFNVAIEYTSVQNVASLTGKSYVDSLGNNSGLHILQSAKVDAAMNSETPELELFYLFMKKKHFRTMFQWTKEKMPLWLAHFEKVVKKHGPTAPIAGGSTVTYADFAMFHVLDATVAQFNNEKYEMAWDKQKNVPTLKAYLEWMKARPNLKAYQESDRASRKFLLLSCFSLSSFSRRQWHCRRSRCWWWW